MTKAKRWFGVAREISTHAPGYLPSLVVDDWRRVGLHWLHEIEADPCSVRADGSECHEALEFLSHFSSRCSLGQTLETDRCSRMRE